MTARWGPAAAGALVVLGSLLFAYAPTASAGTTRALTISNISALPTASFAAFDGNPAKVFDFNGDGKLEIIAQNDNQWVYVFDSKTGKILAQMKTTLPANWGARSFNGPEAAVMTDGGTPRLVVANSAATITMFRYDPVASGTSFFVFAKVWERRLTDCHANPGMDSKPVLADLDKDGRLEILAGTEERGVYALRDDGRLYWKNCLSGGNAEPTVADLNLDGWPDIVHVSDGGVVAALNGRTGGWMWSFITKNFFNVGSASIPVGAAVGQLNGVGGPDIVVGARDSHDATNWDNDHALLLALDHNGKLLWGRQDPSANPLTYTHPIIVDAAKDGKPEIYWGDWNTNGHKPPWDASQAWKPTGPANFYRYDPTGKLVWRQTLDTWWSNKDLALADVDADGVQEVLANGPNAGHDGIWYLDSRTGAKETFVDAYPYKVSRGPIVADLWNTRTMQFVVEAGNAILVYDTHVPYNSAWPHLPYVTRAGASPTPPPTSSTTISPPITTTASPTTTTTLPSPTVTTTTMPTGTNTTGPINTTTSINTTASNTTSPTPTTTTTSPLAFTASYEVSPNVNEWWVEVDVTANEPVAAVDARVNGGSWVALELKSWGHWAKSFFVAAGSKVEFRATSATGAQHTSAPFTWMSSFSATFEPRAVGNNWWVEVKVTSGSTITNVEASVNNGAWTALNPTSWGTWAKSIHAPDGSSVKFRATNSAGATATSATYVWT